MMNEGRNQPRPVTRDPLARCSDCGRLTEHPVGAAIDVVRCECGGRLVFPAWAYLESVRMHSRYATARVLCRWLTAFGIVGAALWGLALLLAGQIFLAAGVILCGVAGALMVFWLVTMLADVADLLTDRGRK